MPTYVEERNGGYYLAGTRVSLDSVVHEFRRGAAPESILRAFPMIGSLERVYGAVAYYLAHKAEIDAHLGRQEQVREDERAGQHLPDDLKERLARVRRSTRHRS